MGGWHGRDRQGVGVPLTALHGSLVAPQGQRSTALFILLSIDEWPEQYCGPGFLFDRHPVRRLALPSPPSR